MRVSGAGLGCPDWPKCFGSWIPPLSASDLPAGFDASEFNFTLAWIEYINRLAGMLTGILIAITAVLAIIHMRRHPKILWASIAAGILVAFQGWYGSIVVATKLKPETVSIHMLLAILIVSLLIYATQRSFYLQAEQKKPPFTYPPLARKLILLLWPLSFTQLLLGTQIRGSIEILLDRYPLLSGDRIFERLGWTVPLHTMLGVATAGLTVITIYLLLKIGRHASELVRRSSWLLVAIALLQILAGILIVALDIPPVGQVFHLWGASLFMGILLILYLEISRGEAGHG